MYKDESRVLLDPKISLVKLDDEIEGRWLDLVFKECVDLVGGLDEPKISSLRLLSNLKEEEYEGGWLMLIADVRFE